MRSPSVALKYAKAFLRLASNQVEAEAFLKQLIFWTNILSQPQIAAFFSSPLFRQEDKRSVLKKTFTQYNEKLTISSSILILLEKKRLRLLPEILEAFKKVMYQRYDIIQATLMTATPLESTITEQLIHKLNALYQKPVQLETEVNPHLIGGGVLSIDSKTIDFSIRSKLKELKKDLLAVEVEKSQ